MVKTMLMYREEVADLGTEEALEVTNNIIDKLKEERAKLLRKMEDELNDDWDEKDPTSDQNRPKGKPR